MAYTFRGIGATNYGKRDFRGDGSYVTTLWFVCFYLPVVPIHSKRVRPTGEVKYFGIQPRRTYAVHEKTKPNLTQVLSTYTWFGAELALFITAKMRDAWWLAVPGAILLGLPWMLRKRALDRVKAETQRREMGFSPELSD